MNPTADPAADLREELHEFLAAARATLRELQQEGLGRIEGVASPLPPAAPLREGPEPVASQPAPSPRAAAPPAADSAAEPALLDAAPGFDWGEAPTLEQVRATLGECTRCRLHERRRNIVFGDGNPVAQLMFVGEGPGETEDERGLPFVGRAGELLTQMIEKGMGIPRSAVYICNAVKCRPPNNRTPLPDEARACSPFLAGQIAAVRPRVIVALGKPATSLLLGREVSITRLRGQWQEYRGIPLMPTFHPAYLLRQYSVENRRKVWEDLKAARARLG